MLLLIVFRIGIFPLHRKIYDLKKFLICQFPLGQIKGIFWRQVTEFILLRFLNRINFYHLPLRKYPALVFFSHFPVTFFLLRRIRSGKAAGCNLLLHQRFRIGILLFLWHPFHPLPHKGIDQRPHRNRNSPRQRRDQYRSSHISFPYCNMPFRSAFSSAIFPGFAASPLSPLGSFLYILYDRFFHLFLHTDPAHTVLQLRFHHIPLLSAVMLFLACFLSRRTHLLSALCLSIPITIPPLPSAFHQIPAFLYHASFARHTAKPSGILFPAASSSLRHSP